MPAAVMVAVTFAVAIVWSTPGVGAEVAAPEVTVTPSTDLLDAQTVTVSGTGFNPNATLYVSTCPPGATEPIDCDAGRFVTVRADGTGTFTTDYAVVRFPTRIFGGSTVDCALVECTLGVADDLTSPRTVVQVALTFRDTDPPLPPPAVTAVPSVDLVDGQRVTVTATGLRPGEPADLRQCPPGVVALAECSRPLGSATADAAGELSSRPFLYRVLSNFGDYVDCAVVTCAIGFESLTGLQLIPIGFVDPVITIDVEPVGTLRADSDDAVARATVSCDMATPVSIYASISQPGVEFRYVLFEQECAPAEPLFAYIPARIPVDETNQFQLGEAEVEVSARPTKLVNLGAPPTAVTDVSETVELVDFEAVAAAIAAGLADPSNTELRQQVQQAIELRIAQDPVFRREFFAAILGGA